MEINATTNNVKALREAFKELDIKIYQRAQYSSGPQNGLEVIKFLVSDEAVNLVEIAAILIGLVKVSGWHIIISRDTKTVRQIKESDSHVEISEEISKSTRIDLIQK